jgi:hypothetical protein
MQWAVVSQTLSTPSAELCMVICDIASSVCKEIGVKILLRIHGRLVGIGVLVDGVRLSQLHVRRVAVGWTPSS